ncbi:MAG: quinoprotein dehydrogenase-associated SoxYZ-like carrier [Hyphomicrobium sp.]
MPTQHAPSRFLFTLLAGTIAAGVLALPPAARADDDMWPSLRKEVFGTRPIAEDDGVVIIDAPERAEDAAVVPITIRVPPSVKGPLKSMTLIIDKNPAPVAAAFKFGPAAGEGGGERRMSTRVRIDTYSNVHAVVETADGKLHMKKVFVKASGGCSAPAPKDADADRANLGKMLVKSTAPALPTTPLREAQVMIKHPNTNGMQMDPISRGYIPARFVKDMTVKSGNDLVFTAEMGISIATNPHFRFTYANGGDAPLTVTAVDTDDTRFTGQAAKETVSQ